MPEEWMEEVLRLMRKHHITCRELSRELGVTSRYVSMILSGKRSPSMAEERFCAAIDELIVQRHSDTKNVR